VPNRDLLLEFCTAHAYLVANMLQRTPDYQKVTYGEPGVHPMDVISERTHSMLDLVLVPAGATHEVITVLSVREATLATDHYLVYFHVNTNCSCH
jgi:hypothetical protein